MKNALPGITESETSPLCGGCPLQRQSARYFTLAESCPSVTPRRPLTRASSIGFTDYRHRSQKPGLSRYPAIPKQATGHSALTLAHLHLQGAQLIEAHRPHSVD